MEYPPSPTPIADKVVRVLTAFALVCGPPIVFRAWQLQEQIETDAAAYEAARLQACGGDPRYNSLYHASDDTPLPALTASTNIFSTDLYGPELGAAVIGTIVIDADGKPQWEADAAPDELSTEHVDGLAEAFRDPYVACTSKLYSEIRVILNQATDKDYGYDDPGYRAADGYIYTSSHVQMAFGTGDTPDGRIFENRGSERAVLTHENTHALIDYMRKSEDPQIRELLHEYESLWRQEYLLVNEQFRAEHGAEIIGHLTNVRDQYAAAGYTDVASAIGLTIEHYAQPQGLDGLSFMQTSDPRFMRSTSIQQQVSQAAADLGFSMSEFYGYEGVNTKGFDQAQAIQSTYMQQAYGHINEGSTLPFSNGIGGEAHISADETAASTVASTQINPRGVLTAVDGLSAERQALTLRSQDVLVQLIDATMSNLTQFMHLDEVAAAR